MNSILIIEDNVSVRTALALFFKREQWNVTLASGRKEALIAVQNHRFTCILLDVDLGSEVGFDVLREIQSYLGEATPCAIFMTGRPSKAGAEMADELRARAYLEKPFDPNELLRIVKGTTKS